MKKIKKAYFNNQLVDYRYGLSHAMDFCDPDEYTGRIVYRHHWTASIHWDVDSTPPLREGTSGVLELHCDDKTIIYGTVVVWDVRPLFLFPGKKHAPNNIYVIIFKGAKDVGDDTMIDSSALVV